LDIENSPNTVHRWQLFGNDTTSVHQVVEPSRLMSVAYKWHSQPETHFIVGPHFREMAENVLPDNAIDGGIKDVWNAITDADAVVTYNGKKFDIPKLNTAFVEYGLGVPAPYQQIDLYQTVKRVFSWPKMSLDYVAQQLLGEGKVPHEGHMLWVKCMAGDPEAWWTMRTYNIGDTEITEKLYDKLLPWIPNHPNVLLYGEDPTGRACPVCGSLSYQQRGTRELSTGVYQQYRCNDCGAWFRDVKRRDGSTVR
jgi:predicted RNA-binding Zn-ribbon protein involved in translation (DUF1610 family)